MVGWEDFRVEGESEAHLLRELHSEGPHAKIGRPAKYKLGVNYVGSWETLHDGVGIAVRRHACALRSAGIPVFLQSESYTQSNMGVTTTVDYSRLPQEILRQVGHMTQAQHADTSVVVRHTVPTQSMLESIAVPRGSRFMSAGALEVHRARTVLYAAFEENKLPNARVRILNLLGAIWTPSQAAKKWLEDSGVGIPIKVIPHPFDEADAMAKVTSRKRGQIFRFLNISKWEPRKAQHDLIGGFLIAFSPEDPTELVLKCNPFMQSADYPKDPEDSIREWLKVDAVKDNGWNGANVTPKLRVIWNKRVPRATLAQMYAESDAYVSCGRSEGFDIPAFDAKLANRRLVHANNGAAWDYRKPSDILIKNHGHARFHPWYNFEVATWPDFDALDVAEALHSAFTTETEVRPLDRKRFSVAHVGELMRGACIEIASELAEVNECL